MVADTVVQDTCRSTGNCNKLWMHKPLITGGKQMGSPMSHCGNHASHVRHYVKTFIENSRTFPIEAICSHKPT